jgi:hypothetical protein
VTQREQVEALIKQPEASTLTAARPDDAVAAAGVA